MNVIARLEFKLAYYDSAVHHFNHNSTRTPPPCNWRAQNDPQRFGEETGRVRNRKTTRDHPNNRIVKIDMNTAKGAGDRRRFAISRTRRKDHQLVLMWEACKKCNNNNNNNNKLLWDFNIQTDHLIPARRPDLTIINKKKENLQNSRLCCPGWPQNKTERVWKEG